MIDMAFVFDELGSRRGGFDEHASAGHQDDRTRCLRTLLWAV